MLTLEDVAARAAALPDVTEGERHGGLTWSVAGKVFAWERTFSQADVKRFGAEPVPAGPVVAIRTADLDEKEAVLAAGLDGLFTISHFNGYPAVLVDLATATVAALEDTLLDGWLTVAPAALAAEHCRDRR